MKQRLITAAVLICIVLIPALFLSGTILFPILAAFFCVVGVYEMLKCLGTFRKWAVSIPALLLAAALPLCSMFCSTIAPNLTIAEATVQNRVMYLLLVTAVLILYMFYLFAAAVLGRRDLSFADVASSFVAVFYLVLAFTAMPIIRLGENGQYYYLLCFIGPWITDSFAYFVGYFFGRHKLIPEISPKKTVEGAVGGVVFCILAFVLFGFFAGRATGLSPNYLVLALVGAVASVLSQLGDLFASLVKREHDIKDYGTIFPGHGGVMDRFDSVVGTAPFLLIICTLDALLSFNMLL